MQMSKTTNHILFILVCHHLRGTIKIIKNYLLHFIFTFSILKYAKHISVLLFLIALKEIDFVDDTTTIIKTKQRQRLTITIYLSCAVFEVIICQAILQNFDRYAILFSRKQSVEDNRLFTMCKCLPVIIKNEREVLIQASLLC